MTNWRHLVQPQSSEDAIQLEMEREDACPTGLSFGPAARPGPSFGGTSNALENVNNAVHSDVARRRHLRQPRRVVAKSEPSPRDWRDAEWRSVRRRAAQDRAVPRPTTPADRTTSRSSCPPPLSAAPRRRLAAAVADMGLPRRASYVSQPPWLVRQPRRFNAARKDTGPRTALGSSARRPISPALPAGRVPSEGRRDL